MVVLGSRTGVCEIASAVSGAEELFADALLALEVKREKRTVWGVSYTCLDKRCVDAVLHPFCASRHIANEEALRASLLKECDLVEERVESDV